MRSLAIGSADDAGLALVELLVVLAIAALMISIAIGYSPGARARLDVEAAASDLVSHIQQARLEAINRAAVNRLEFDTNRRHYQTGFNGKTHKLPDGVDIELTPVPGGAADPSMSFYPDGTVRGAPITLMKGERRSTITVNWLTGHASTGN